MNRRTFVTLFLAAAPVVAAMPSEEAVVTPVESSLPIAPPVTPNAWIALYDQEGAELVVPWYSRMPTCLQRIEDEELFFTEANTNRIVYPSATESRTVQSIAFLNEDGSPHPVMEGVAMLPIDRSRYIGMGDTLCIPENALFVTTWKPSQPKK